MTPEAAPTPPATALAALLEPFRRDPARSAVISDFDGTLSAIVVDPADARPVAGAVELLHRLARRFGRVAVVSGRPAAFLAQHLRLAKHPRGLLAVGLYGLEQAVAGDPVRISPGAEAWRPVVEQAAARAEAELPPGVEVERKGLTVTFHWRPAQAEAAGAAAYAEGLAAELGLELRPARMSAELCPPLGVDKGNVVTALCEGMGAAICMGDDVGDLAGFRALERLKGSTGLHALRIAVSSDEVPPELVAEADAVVDGSAGALSVLAALDELPV